MFAGVIDLEDASAVIVSRGRPRDRSHGQAYGFPPRPFAAGAHAEQIRSIL